MAEGTIGFIPNRSSLSHHASRIAARFPLLALLFCFELQAGGHQISHGAQSAPDAPPASRARLFFFTAPWCGPCHKIQPLVEEMVRGRGSVVELVIVDFEKDPVAVREFAVESIPTMVLLDRLGKPLLRINGANRQALDALRAEIGRLAKPGSAPPRRPG